MTTIVVISAGLSVFPVSLWLLARSHRLARTHGVQSRWWWVLAAFIILFSLGYGLTLVSLASGAPIAPDEAVVATLLVSGAAFVLLCGYLFWRMSQKTAALVTALEEHRARLRTMADSLEAEVEATQSELVDTDARLQVVLEERAALERQRFDARLVHAQKLESLGMLAGGVAHDFNNLLAGILGHADVALMDVPVTSPAHEPLQHVRQAAVRAGELTRQLLTYAGKGRFAPERLDLSTVAHETAKLLTTMLAPRARLVYELAEDLPAVEADGTQLRQVIMNLITNASDALGDAAGTITLRTGVSECTAADLDNTEFKDPLPPGRYVTLDVIDTGSGLSDEARARMFDPFFTTKELGQGLGLAATQGIIRGHGGALSVLSVVDEGTHFRVMLPATDEVSEAAPTDQAPRPVPTLAGDLTVLIADDEESIVAMLSRLLERMGFSVLTARDGAECLRVYAAHAGEIDLIVLDLVMPERTGDDVLSDIRAGGSTVPILLTSGYDRHAVPATLEASANVAFLVKPYSARDMSDAVCALLGLESPRARSAQ